MFADSINDFHFFMDLPMAKLRKLAKIARAIHEADHAYSIQSDWSLLLLTGVPLTDHVINLPNTFTYYFDLLNFTLECRLLYFRVLPVSCWFIL